MVSSSSDCVRSSRHFARPRDLANSGLDPPKSVLGLADWPLQAANWLDPAKQILDLAQFLLGPFARSSKLYIIFHSRNWVVLMTGFLICVWAEQKHVTAWHSTWSPEVILGAPCSVFRVGHVRRGPGAKFGRKAVENRRNSNLDFSVLV